MKQRRRLAQTGAPAVQRTPSPQKLAKKSTEKGDSGLIFNRFCLIFVALAIFLNLFSLITLVLSSWSFNDVFQWFYSGEPDDLTIVRMNATYLDVPLTKSFRLDFQRVLKVRENNMRLYKYPYNRRGIDRRSNLSLQEYRDVYDGKWPVLVDDVIPTWKASDWTREFLCETYGQERVVMKGVSGGLHQASTVALPLEMFCNHTNDAGYHSWTYVEDELFIPMRPWLRKDVGEMVPGDEDFFQWFPIEVRPWNSMLLWGTAFSRSSLHIDPYNWTGTNAVISGMKRWRLFPPGQDQFLYVLPNRRSEFPLNCYKYNSPIDTFDLDDYQFPEVHRAKYIEFDQFAGELLILPSGWFHQAFNLEETIAVSSQFTNINNYRVILEEILKIDNIARNQIPSYVSKLSPAEQVKSVMSLLPPHIIERGRQTTKNILAQVKQRKNYN